MKNNWFAVNRSILESDLWLSEVFSRAHAWIDIIALARFKAGHARLRGVKITLDRGELCWSEIELAKRWKWSRGKVRRFLSELKTDQRIVQRKTPVTTVISVLNYDLYQPPGTTDETADGPQTGQQTDRKQDSKRTADGTANGTGKNNVKNDGMENGENEGKKKCASDVGRDAHFDFFNDDMKVDQARYRYRRALKIVRPSKDPAQRFKDFSFLAKVCVLSMTVFSEDWLVDSCEAVRINGHDKKPFAYFHRVLESKATAIGKNFKQELARCRVPPNFNNGLNLVRQDERVLEGAGT